jgi:hypothetical protein
MGILHSKNVKTICVDDYQSYPQVKLVKTTITEDPKTAHLFDIKSTVYGSPMTHAEDTVNQLFKKAVAGGAVRALHMFNEGDIVSGELDRKVVSKALFKALNHTDLEIFYHIYATFQPTLSQFTKEKLLKRFCLRGKLHLAPSELLNTIPFYDENDPLLHAMLHNAVSSCDWQTILQVLGHFPVSLFTRRCDHGIELNEYILLEPIKRGRWDIVEYLTALFNMSPLGVYAKAIRWLESRTQRAKDINRILDLPNGRQIAECTLMWAIIHNKVKLIANYLSCRMITLDDIIIARCRATL